MKKQAHINNKIEHFEWEDPKWLLCLKDRGVCVIKGMISKEQVDQAISLFWDHNEKLSKIKRDDPTTWINANWPAPKNGFITDWGFPHCQAAWYLRTNPKVT